MRKLILSFVFLLSLTFMTSCGGGGPEADIKKAAGVMCELKGLVDGGVEENKDKIKALFKKSEQMQKDMEEKYKDMKDDKELGKKLQEVMEKKLKDCGLDGEGLQEMMMKIMKAGVDLEK